MATVTLAVEQAQRSGLEPTFNAVDATDTYKFQNAGATFLYVKNENVADATVSIVTPTTVDGLAVADRTVVVTAAEERIIGPFPTAYYNDSSGLISFTQNKATDVTIAVVRVA